MTGPTIDLEERNPLGGLDRLITGVGLAVIAVFPTLAVAIIQPWKLVPLLIADEPTGRRDLLLSPGAYFILSLAVILILTGFVATPEIIQSNGGLIGPRLAADVSDTAQDGDVWKTLSRLAPIFILAIIFGLAGRALTPWAGRWWDLRVSLRMSFYVIATTMCWIILSSMMIDTLGLTLIDLEMKSRLYAINTVPILLLPLWMYFWGFKTGGILSPLRSSCLTGFMALIVAAIVGLTSFVFNG